MGTRYGMRFFSEKELEGISISVGSTGVPDLGAVYSEIVAACVRGAWPIGGSARLSF
jgi:hypothetical protein